MVNKKRNNKKLYVLLILILFIFMGCSTTKNNRPIISTKASYITGGVPGLTHILNGEIIEGLAYMLSTTIIMNLDDTKVPKEIISILNPIGGLIYIYSYFDGVYTTDVINTQYKVRRVYENTLYTYEEKISIIGGSIFIGMSKDACIESIGKPQKINSTYGKYGVNEQLVYEDKYVYIKNGYITGWQE